MTATETEPLHGEIVLADAHAPVTLFRTDDPAEVVRRASQTARELAKVIRKQELAISISGREHVRVEGWTLLGTMLGVFPICTWTREVTREEQPFGWEARVEARTLTGLVVGAAEAQCLRSEDLWGFSPKDRYGKPLRARDDFSLRSMAQTRATAKALRLPLGFVMTLAGYEATPAEEMADVQAGEPKASQAQVKKIRALIRKLAAADVIDAPEFAAGLSADYSVSKAEELTKAEASEVIDLLEQQEKAQ